MSAACSTYKKVHTSGNQTFVISRWALGPLPGQRQQVQLRLPGFYPLPNIWRARQLSVRADIEGFSRRLFMHFFCSLWIICSLCCCPEREINTWICLIIPSPVTNIYVRLLSYTSYAPKWSWLVWISWLVLAQKSIQRFDNSCHRADHCRIEFFFFFLLVLH